MSDSLGSSFLSCGAIARLDSTTIKAKFIEQVEHFSRPKSYANMLRSTRIARIGDNSLKFLTPVRHRRKKYARMRVCVEAYLCHMQTRRCENNTTDTAQPETEIR